VAEEISLDGVATPLALSSLDDLRKLEPACLQSGDVALKLA
jgi:hypothetical protein